MQSAVRADTRPVPQVQLGFNPATPAKSVSLEPIDDLRCATGQGKEAIIFRVCKELRVSDIQIRTHRPVYIETYKGMESLDFLGVISQRNADEVLKELIRNRESLQNNQVQELRSLLAAIRTERDNLLNDKEVREELMLDAL